MSKQKASPRQVEWAHQRARAIALRLQGKTYEAIAAEMGITKQTAHHHVLKSLEETRKETAEQTEEVRELELQRLDALLEELWPNRGDPRTADTILRTMERRARLLGLDAPDKIDAKVESMDEAAKAERAAALIAAALARKGNPG